jgi:hypothetical protein
MRWRERLPRTRPDKVSGPFEIFASTESGGEKLQGYVEQEQ